MRRLPRYQRWLVILATCLTLMGQVPVVAAQAATGDSGCCGQCHVAPVEVKSCCAPKAPVEATPACPKCAAEEEKSAEWQAAAVDCCCDVQQLPPATPAKPVTFQLKTIQPSVLIATLAAIHTDGMEFPSANEATWVSHSGKRPQQWLCIWRN